MLSEEWLQVILADRAREIEAARLARLARDAAPREGRVRTWFRGRLAARNAPSSAPQRGRAATDSSA
jgi:hypothetical protein